ncbi:hypothetical protein JCM3775_007324 [Rhodotorula graminis]
MANYSAYAPSLPPAPTRAANSSSSHSSSHHHQQQQQQQYAMGHQQQHRPGYGNGDALSGQFGSLSMGQHEQPPLGDPRARGPLAPLETRSPAPSAPSSSSTYSAANRPRPQLSPVLTSAPPRAYQLRDGASPSAYDRAPDSDAPRVPRKSSLSAAHDSHTAPGLQQAHPPLPRLPPSGSSSAYPSHQASASGGSASQRDSAGGEQVFDGTALAAAGEREREGGSAQGPGRSASSATATQGKKANPLADLIATETAYVADLGAIIKRVAAAWSRANFPPPVLDSMFRAVEAVYRVNKGLLAQLLEIGPSPSSPKALGDLLMRWIDEIEPAYSRYAATLQDGYDTHAPVQSNERLAPILASLTWPNTLPPPPSPSSSLVTLDTLFTLPVVRVAYYQRLYAKLLRSTQEGRSDHALLVSANDKLRRLAAMCDDARARHLDGETLGTTRPLVLAPAVPVVPAQPRARDEDRGEQARGGAPPPPRLELDLGRVMHERGSDRGSGGGGAGAAGGGGGSAGLDSPSSSSYRSSGATGMSTANTSATNGGGYAATSPLRVEDLEHRLDPSRALDIFTMKPRKCKLQMQPPSLAFQRQLRKAGPVSLSFVPSSDPSGRDVRIARAHLVLLTDLFLVCAPVEPADEHAAAPGADFWLLYPPLAGKHLRVRDSGAQQAHGEFEVAIMGKERLVFRPLDAAGDGEEQQAREWRAALDEAIRFGTAQGSRQNSSASGSAVGGGASSPISPTYRSSPLSPSFQASVQPPTAPNSTAPSPHLMPSSSTASTAPPPSPGFSSAGSNTGRPALQLMPPGAQAPPSRTHSSSSSDGAPAAATVSRPERNASMLSSASHAGPPPSASSHGGFTGNAFVQSPTGSGFPHSPIGNGGNSSRGASPYPGSDSSAYGRQSPYGQQQQQLQQQQQNGGYPAYPAPPRSPYSAQEFSSSSRPSSSRPSSRQSNGSYQSSQAYPDFDPRTAPPPLPKERSYNGVDISGRGGPLYPTSLNGSASRSGSGMLAPGSSHQQVHRARSADGLRSSPPMSSSAQFNLGHHGGGGAGGAAGFGSQYRMPSQTLLEDRSASAPGSSRASGVAERGVGLDFSPPTSPMSDDRERQLLQQQQQQRADDKTSVVAQMRCKIFLQQHHSVWKSLGTGKLKLFHSLPSGTKQLVVDSDKGGGKTVISTIVLTDGVERVGKTGVAIELSDQGDRTGIVYMLQMKTEQSATGLFEQLLVGTDRAKR